MIAHYLMLHMGSASVMCLDSFVGSGTIYIVYLVTSFLNYFFIYLLSYLLS